MKAITSAPSKVILFGEHAVVYGKPAIATAIDLRTKAIVEESDEVFVEAFVEVRDLIFEVKDLAPIKALIEEAMRRYSLSGLKVLIHSEVPIGAGLGSSASAAVAVAAGISRIVHGEIRLDEVIELADVAERVAHGKPSGIDTRIVAYGGTMRYVPGRTPKFTDALSGQSLLIGYTGIERSTRELVLSVRSLYERNEFARRIVDLIGDLVEEVWRRLLNGTRLEDLKEEARINHGLLSALGVSHPLLDELVYEARRLDVGAKLTGAGGGGSAIAFLSDDGNDELVEARNQAISNYRHVIAEDPKHPHGVFLTKAGAEGVREERFCYKET